MTLHQYHELRLWHLRHWRRHPVEKNVWELVLTIWLMGWVGAPTAFILHSGWAETACLSVLFLPGLYVGLRRRLHRHGLLRCEWISALG